MKRVVVLVLALSLILTLTPSGIAANSLGRLLYWFADDIQNGPVSSIIKKWEKNPTYNYKKLDSTANSDLFPLALGCGNSARQWGDALDISITYTNNNNSADIIVRGGDANELKGFGHEIFDGVWGHTIANNIRTDGVYTLPDGSEKELQVLIGTVSVGIVYFPDSNHSTLEYEHTILHEFGHAMGWYGHSSKSYDVMCQGYSTKTTLQSRDKLHLSQIY